MNSELKVWAIEETYNDCESLIYHLVWKYIRLHRCGDSDEFDEILSRAHEHFMDAYVTCNDAMSPHFSNWVWARIWLGLLLDDNKNARWNKNASERLRLLPRKLHGVELVDFLDSLNEDARNLMLLYKSCPEDFKKIFKSRMPRKRLSTYLKEKHAWTMEQVQNAISNLLSIFKGD